MISLDNSHTSKTEAKSSVSLLSDTKDDRSSLSFSELLKGIKLQADKKNDVLVLKLDDEVSQSKEDTKSLSKIDSLLSLLKNDEEEKLSTKDTLKSEPLELNPKVKEAISDTLTIKEVKTLIIKAKQYLKAKIIKTEAFKKSEIKELPKTLKGLVKVAKGYDIDISKITIQEIKEKSIKTALPKTLKNKLETKDIQPQDTKIKDTKDISKYQTKQIITKDEDTEKEIKLPKEVLKQPIFQTKLTQKKEFSTEELIQAREIKEVKTQTKKTTKNRADETLRMLLSGDTKSDKKEIINNDISIASTKVILPETKSEITKGLESLLGVESNDNNSKTDTLLTTHKADSLEVKMNEAKQMIKYLSHDVKQAIEDYKAPFTRIKVQLNPQKLGEVDLTVIQRGKNLIVNLSSNNTAINTLAINANELKVQLNNNGINNATLNFNNNSQSEQQGSFGQQQNNQHEQRQAQREYNYFESEEQNEEILSSLEIVVPNYA
jgi:hypothetical protein